MDIYQTTLTYLEEFPSFGQWPEMDAILRRSASSRPRDWNLPICLCQALGTPPEKAVPASAALACAQISIILVDDMLDDDPRGAYRRIGVGRASNLALAFQAAGVEALLESRSRPKLEAVRCLNQMLYQTAFGQELDVKNPDDEKSYWQVVTNKSAPFYGCAFQLGALGAESSVKTTKGIRRLGELYGEMIQIHDDLNDTLTVPANPDWLQGRNPLPILFAQTVNHPEREKFMALRQTIPSNGALEEAQEILIRCGAVSYCVDQLLQRHQAVQNLLDELSLPAQEWVDALIHDLIAPVQRLFETLSLPSPVLLTSKFLHRAE